jgi:phosphohistidine phosphatase
MKTLLLLRHAKSSRDDPHLEDHARPLNARGKEAAKQIGRLIRDEKLVPDRMISSTAVRARKTAAKAAKSCGYDKAIELSEAIYLAKPAAHRTVLNDVPDHCDSVLVVGHNPGISEFLHQLTDSGEEMPTAALAVIELPIESWSTLSADTRGSLRQMWRPRELE